MYEVQQTFRLVRKAGEIVSTGKGVLDKKLALQMQRWRDDLLTIDRRQRLVYFQHPKSGTFEVVEPGCLAVEALINGGDVVLESNEPVELDPGESAAGIGLPTRGPRTLRVAAKTSAQILSTSKRLHQRSEQEYADRGVWTLYLGYGMLNWVDPADSKKISSPLLLVPVRLVKEGQQYVLRRTEDEPALNTALGLKLSRDFAIELPEFEVDDLNVSRMLPSVRRAVSDESGWTVDDRVVMSIFSFHKEAMYRDLEQNEARIVANGMIQLMALGPDAPHSSDISFDPVADEELDSHLAPEKLHSILDADGSQRKCVLAAREGRSFIMDGPPGTGKSQTIANIIAELMATGKTVLFVSEKAAALDVVRDRLTHRQLDPFLLELHSHKATRKQVVQTLHAELTRRPVAKNLFSDTDRSQLVKSRKRLTDHASAMNEIRRPLGRSLHDVLGRLAQLTDFDAYSSGDPKTLGSLSAEHLAELQMAATALSKVWRPAEEGESFLWRGLSGEGLTQAQIKELDNDVSALSLATERLLRTVRLFEAQVPFWSVDLDVAGIRSRTLLTSLLRDRRRVPQTWFTATNLGPLLTKMEKLQSEENLFNAKEDHIRQACADRWNRSDQDLQGPLDEFLQNDSKIFSRPLNQLTLGQIDGIEQGAATAAAQITSIMEKAQELGRLFDLELKALTLNKCRALSSLAELSQRGSLPEPHWINPSVQGALDESARVLSQLSMIVRERQAAMESVYRPEILSLDINGLKVRFETHHRGLKLWSKQARLDKKTLRDMTVAGVVNKEVIAMLGDALAWQTAQANLSANEPEYGPRLGSYYHGAATDFTRITQALEVARSAIKLAGDDIGPSTLARQLSRSSTPDLELIPLARDVAGFIASFGRDTSVLFNEKFHETLGDVPLETLHQNLAEAGENFKAARPLRARLCALVGEIGTLSSARTVLRQISELSNIEDATAQAAAPNSEALGPRYRPRGTDWATLREDHAWTSSVRKAIGGPIDREAVRFVEEFEASNLDLADNHTRWLEAKDKLAAYFDHQRSVELGAELDRDLEDAEELLADLSSDTASDVDIWFEYKKLCLALNRAGVSTTLASLQESRSPSSHVVRAVERAALEPWAEQVIDGDSRLSEHRASGRESLLEQFKDLDSRLINNAHSAIVEACVGRRPRTNVGPAAVIAHEANKKSRHKPIRRLLEETGSVVQALKPCFMMSPLSVSQYLPPSLIFDVVIFDEASQVMPADSVNCIYRGKQLIVAGDQKQLPPTSFFTSADIETDDEDEPDNFDSVLDLCKASGAMTSLPLSWHYRSLHEDLITYSNYRIYEGKLNTFPGAAEEANDLGVHHEFVAGIYQRGAGSRNPIEAERVVDRVLEHRRLNSDLSLGVVTFSTQQAEAVSEAIERRAEHEPLLAGLMEDHDRLHGFFVKNIESVQGDERDIIIFSIGYGPDEVGKLTMNFGPLTRKGGERRLNVAITRARRRVEVVSSFHAGDMTDGTSEGNRHLKNYLDFAARGRAALASDISGTAGEADSPFEEEVLRVVRSAGFNAVSQVGAAGYRIDIGVRHPDRAGTFMLGIECDGAAYHSAKSARDRDRLRESVLRGLGWEIHRIWGLSWYRDRATQEAALKVALDTALLGGNVIPAISGPVNAPEPMEYEEIDLSAPPAWTVPYTMAAQPPRRYRYQPGDADALTDLIQYAGHVVSVEAPLHVDTLHTRLREHWGTGGIGSRARSNVERALALARVSGMKVKLDREGFIRVDGADSVNVRRPIDPSDPRKAGAIPPEEFDEALRLVVADAIVITEEELMVAVRNVFGWARRGPDIQTALQRSLLRAAKKGYVVRRPDGSYETTQ
jgi:very-short-patch-repair endonuclease